MKRTELIRELTAAGCVLKRHGKKHDIYMNPGNARKASVPRHTEIRDSLATATKRQLGV